MYQKKNFLGNFSINIYFQVLDYMTLTFQNGKFSSQGRILLSKYFAISQKMCSFAKMFDYCIC